jgi:predicted nucleotidyltransferase
VSSVVQTKADTLDLLRFHRDEILSFGVSRLGLFGPFVREQQHSDSDVDLLVEFDPGRKTFDNFIHLSFFLEELLNRHVELVTLDALSPYLGPNIRKEVENVILSG